MTPRPVSLKYSKGLVLLVVFRNGYRYSGIWAEMNVFLSIWRQRIGLIINIIITYQFIQTTISVHLRKGSWSQRAMRHTAIVKQSWKIVKQQRYSIILMCSLYSISNQQPKKLSYNPLSWKSLPAEVQEHCKLGLMHQPPGDSVGGESEG